MAITKLNPRTIWLGGACQVVNTIVSSEAITPGHLVERASGKYKKHATSGGYAQPAFALDQSMMNKDYDVVYASGDLVEVGVGVPGSSFLAWLASGQNVVDGAKLMSNGAGLLTAVTSTNIVVARATEDKNATTGDARIRVEVV